VRGLRKASLPEKGAHLPHVQATRHSGAGWHDHAQIRAMAAVFSRRQGCSIHPIPSLHPAPMLSHPAQMVQLRLDAARESGGPASLGIVPVLPAELPVEWLDDLGAETGADRCATSE